jgi:hypothetical protein
VSAEPSLAVLWYRNLSLVSVELVPTGGRDGWEARALQRRAYGATPTEAVERLYDAIVDGRRRETAWLEALPERK